MAFGFFLDAALTTVATSISPVQDDQGATAPVDYRIYFGNATTGTTLQTLTNPGTDQITVSCTDSANGSGASVAMTQLALNQGALGAATPGASLNLGTAIPGGTANAVSFWIRIDDNSGVAGQKNDLTFTTNVLGEL
jgi:uncharacterized protein (DUF736 family)